MVLSFGAHATYHVLYYVPPSTNSEQQAFIRLTNPNDSSVGFTISAIDDEGNWSDTGAQTLTLDANETIHLNSTDIDFGNPNKGLEFGFGSPVGNWRIVVQSDSTVSVMSYIRTPNGFLNDMHDVVGQKTSQTSHTVPVFNPASNTNQVSKLRISNDVNEDITVTISAIDDNGSIMEQTVTATIPALRVLELTAIDLEMGNESKGLSGKFGDGLGKWRLDITTSNSSTVMNMLVAPGGYVSNLSGISDDGVDDQEVIYVDNTSVFETYVNGSFNGWDGSTIVELANGQTWKQVGYYYQYNYSYIPDVTLYRVNGIWKMWVEGIDQAVSVTQL
jgi:hypothetical protein